MSFRGRTAKRGRVFRNTTERNQFNRDRVARTRVPHRLSKTLTNALQEEMSNAQSGDQGDTIIECSTIEVILGEPTEFDNPNSNNDDEDDTGNYNITVYDKRDGTIINSELSNDNTANSKDIKSESEDLCKDLLVDKSQIDVTAASLEKVQITVKQAEESVTVSKSEVLASVNASTSNLDNDSAIKESTNIVPTEKKSNEVSSDRIVVRDISWPKQNKDEEKSCNKEAELSKGKAENTEQPNSVTAENLKQTISEMQDEGMFPVIEIMEEGGVPEIVEVIDVDNRKTDCNPTSANGVCIEIMSDEDEVQVAEVAISPVATIPQTVVDTDVECQKNHLDTILQQVKMLSSTEFLLFYLNLPPKWNDKESSIKSTDVVRTKLENNDILIPEKNKAILRAIKDSIKESSKITVESIVNKIKDLTIKEYIWLRCYMPNHSINPSLHRSLLPNNTTTANQTVLWMQTHFEENPNCLILKQDVFNRYENYCKLNNTQFLSSSRFGKLINQVFPNIGRKRLRAKGNSAYYYVGLQPRYQLDTPRLPKLKRRSADLESVEIKCEVDIEEDPSKKQQPEAPTIILNGINNSYKNERANLQKDSDNSYRSKQLDGHTILIHDPLALLDMSTNNAKSHNDTSFRKRTPLIKYKFPKITTQLHNSAVKKYPSAKSLKLSPALNSSKPNKKYQEYRHPSVKNVLKKFNPVVLPPEIHKINISPSVTINNRELNNWYRERIVKRLEKFSSLVLKNGPDNFNVKCTHCGDACDVSGTYAKQLNDLKENISSVVITQSQDNSKYNVARICSKAKLCKNTFPIIKHLNNRHNFTKCTPTNVCQTHLSVERLRKKFKNIAIPQEVARSDIDPVIVLNSAEVVGWYIKQLNKLKHAISNNNMDATSSRQSISSSRQSRAKLMNFCEIDSSDDENDNVALAEYQTINKNSQIDNTKLSAFSESNQINLASVVEKSVHTYAAPFQHEDMPQWSGVGQKRLYSSDEDNNEIQSKRKKVYSSESRNNSECSYFEKAPPSKNVGEKPFACQFCPLTFNDEKVLIMHGKLHLLCGECQKRLRGIEDVTEHLANHCIVNNSKNRPFIKLHRIDSVQTTIVEKCSRTFKEPDLVMTTESTNLSKVNANIENFRSATILSSECVEMPNLKQLCTRTYSKVPRSPTIRILKTGKSTFQIQTPTVSSENQQDQTHRPTRQEPKLQLKNTISSNLNKILLLSTNTTQSSQQASNIVYRTVYVNNTSVQPSSNVSLNSVSYNPPTNFAMTTNPSCSNPDLQQPPTFMQIVESPSTSVLEYGDPMSHSNTLGAFEQHQDHSYHQQQFENDMVYESDGVPQISEIESADDSSPATNFGPFFEQSVKTDEPEENYLIHNSDATDANNPTPGQFRIRVKSIQELR